MADYFKVQQPTLDPLDTLDRVQSGLALFAVIIIVRFLFQRIHALVSKKLKPASSNSQLPAALKQVYTPPAWSFDEKVQSGRTSSSMGKNRDAASRDVCGSAGTTKLNTKLSIDQTWNSGAEHIDGQFISRMPPAPPLTSPGLSSAVFTFSSGQPHAIVSFIHQPNPDYTSSTASAISQLDSKAWPTTPRRRSYHKVLPIGMSTPRQSSEAEMDSAATSFFPSSYPPTSPLLPPPPPDATDSFDHGQAHKREMGVKGEIISALDNEGAGWTRHTRVYGGGVCLACAASGGQDGGGFFGATVTPEEMRQDAYTARSGNLLAKS